nr:4-hydroxythreonine-4-phosphate dehydrogenase PdxA [Thermomonas flagellata]
MALVPGEPSGIGPELVVRALQRDWGADFVLYGDPRVLHAAAARLGLPLPTQLHWVELPCPAAAVAGRPDPANAASVVAALTQAGRACLDEACDGLVTGPVHKAVINQAGIAFTGTTGLLAEQAGCDVVMMLANPAMRVALQTVHLPLRAVPEAITADALARTLRILDAALRTQFGIPQPVIAVLGLNPHAGEDGHLGREELEVIAPTLEALRRAGLHLRGPLPADTAFLPEKLRGVDAVLAMYHDQGLPVLKHADFAHAVNITLGLPYPRVAVDHGTALDLAGTGQADPSSLFAAIATCAQLARRRHTA